jgi:hypothetical protein
MRKGRIAEVPCFRKGAVLLLAVVLGLALTVALVAYAQEPTEEPEGAVYEGSVSDQAINDLPPPGYSVLYMFTGASDRLAGATSPRSVTAVHCSNYGTAAATTTVQIFDWNLSVLIEGTAVISPGWMRTFSTRDTGIMYRNEVPMSRSLNESVDQGSGRIMATQSTLICTAQVLGPIGVTPTYMINLDLFQP